MSDLALIKGETFSHVYTIVDTDGTAVNLTGYTLSAYAQPQTQILNSPAQIPITIAVLVAASGTVTVTIPYAITEKFTTNNPITILIQALKNELITSITISNLTETFATLLYAGDYNLKPAYVSTADPLDISVEDCLFWGGSAWILYHNLGNSWESSNPVATPDLATTWTANIPATGSPTVTPSSSSPSIKHLLLTEPILILPSLPNGSW